MTNEVEVLLLGELNTAFKIHGKGIDKSFFGIEWETSETSRIIIVCYHIFFLNHKFNNMNVQSQVGKYDSKTHFVREKKIHKYVFRNKY